MTIQLAVVSVCGAEAGQQLTPIYEMDPVGSTPVILPRGF